MCEGGPSSQGSHLRMDVFLGDLDNKHRFSFRRSVYSRGILCF